MICSRCGNDEVCEGHTVCLECLSMPKALYLVGASATGKTSTMTCIQERLGLVTGDWYKIYPTTHAEFRGEPLEDMITGEYRGLSLGVTRPGGFSGTDAIGMASHSEAMAWLEDPTLCLPELILGEGKRLGTGLFLVALAARTDLTVGHLVAPKHVLDFRCDRRGSKQNETFRKATVTQTANTARIAREAGVRVVEIDTETTSSMEAAGILLRAAGIPF